MNVARYVPYIFIPMIIGYLLYAYVYMRPFSDATGDPIDITQEPLQEELDEPEIIEIRRGDNTYEVKKIYSYDISGLVIMAESYWFFYKSDFFYVDLALIWGDQVDRIIEEYDFKQMGRWLFWSIDRQVSAKERHYITTHISNNHMIPAEGNWNIEKAIRWIDKGDKVRIKGYLVSIKGMDNPLSISSSFRRDDSGDGACEVIWVEELQINEDIYY